MSLTIYDINAVDINGDVLNFADLKGKVLIIVNTASKCGFTKQYAELEQLYCKYRDNGLEIVGFPCNQFANQEPGNEHEIQQFCDLNYHISFKMMQKILVNGIHTHPLYRILKRQARGFLCTPCIKWNFTKFLVNRDGTQVTRYGPQISPIRMELEIQSCLDRE